MSISESSEIIEASATLQRVISAMSAAIAISTPAPIRIIPTRTAAGLGDEGDEDGAEIVTGSGSTGAVGIGGRLTGLGGGSVWTSKKGAQRPRTRSLA